MRCVRVVDHVVYRRGDRLEGSREGERGVSRVVIIISLSSHCQVSDILDYHLRHTPSHLFLSLELNLRDD